MKKSDISNISNAESVERAEESVRSSVQPSGKFGGKADRLFGADPAGLDESARGIAVLVIVGVAVGLLSGMFGIGGGTVIVPALSMLFGASDLIARGTSLLAMFPNSITTSVANLKRRLVHVKAALIIGLVAAVTAPFGTWIAGAVSPRVGSVLFACYLCVLLIRSLFVAVKAIRSARASS